MTEEATELVKRVAKAFRDPLLRRRKIERGPLWARAADFCGLGSTSAYALCRDFDFEPESDSPTTKGG